MLLLHSPTRNNSFNIFIFFASTLLTQSMYVFTRICVFCYSYSFHFYLNLLILMRIVAQSRQNQWPVQHQFQLCTLYVQNLTNRQTKYLLVVGIIAYRSTLLFYLFLHSLILAICWLTAVTFFLLFTLLGWLVGYLLSNNTHAKGVVMIWRCCQLLGIALQRIFRKIQLQCTTTKTKLSYQLLAKGKQVELFSI